MGGDGGRPLCGCLFGGVLSRCVLGTWDLGPGTWVLAGVWERDGLEAWPFSRLSLLRRG